MMPSPADLAYFAEIAATSNVSRAAERLGISQPSLSLAMQRLETAVGTPLFTRSKRGVSLTQAGKQLLAHTRKLLETWQGVRAEALASVNEIQGSYSIGCHPSVALNTLPAFLPQLMEKHPKLDIRLHHDISRKIAEDVISLKIDIGLVVNPVQHPDLIIHRLCGDEMTLWAAAKHVPDVLICDPELAQSQSLLKQFKKAGLSFSRTIVSGNLEVIAALAAAGCGTAILPARVAQRAAKKLKKVPRAPVFHDDHCLIYRIENKGVKSIQTINAAIRKLFEKA